MNVISIIIPVYNVEPYLPQCIESLLSQAYKDFELILVDDGSKDNSLNICEDYAKKDQRVVVAHQENSGVSTARNNGLKLAKGEWITFIDSDDWVDKSFLEDFQLEKYHEADLVCQGLKFIDHNTGNVKRERRFGDTMIEAPDPDGELARQDVLSFGVTVCKCFKRSVIEKYQISFDELVSYHEDHIFTLSYISHSKRIATIDACGYNYRCGHNPASLSKRRHPYSNQVQACDLMMKSLKEITSQYVISDAYFRKIATFCLSVKINGMISLFGNKNEKDVFYKMKESLAPFSDFVNYFEPRDWRYRVVRYFSLDQSGVLLFLFFWFHSKLS